VHHFILIPSTFYVTSTVHCFNRDSFVVRSRINFCRQQLTQRDHTASSVSVILSSCCELQPHCRPDIDFQLESGRTLHAEWYILQSHTRAVSSSALIFLTLHAGLDTFIPWEMVAPPQFCPPVPNCSLPPCPPPKCIAVYAVVPQVAAPTQDKNRTLHNIPCVNVSWCVIAQKICFSITS
jgi:hypothetical protein